MFIWKTEIILNQYKQHLPRIYNVFRKGTSHKAIKKNWSKCPSISVDYGILEKAKDTVLIKAGNIGWSDLGSWESLFDILSKNKNNNVIKGEVIDLNCQTSLIWSSKKINCSDWM